MLATLFIWTYLPQVLFLRIFHGPGAWLNGAVLVLGEGAAITALLFEAWLVDSAQVDVFDSVLVAHGHEALVTTRRPVEPSAASSSDDGPAARAVRDPRMRLGPRERGATFAPFSFRQIAEFVLLLPLNLVPWIGSPLFLWLTGTRAGPLAHHRLFKQKDMHRRERREWVRQRRLGYSGFGSMALTLQLVPILSMVFLLTSAAGAALWAVRMEDELASDRAEQEGGAARERDDSAGDGHVEAEGHEHPPPYTEYEDDPV